MLLYHFSRKCKHPPPLERVYRDCPKEWGGFGIEQVGERCTKCGWFNPAFSPDNASIKKIWPDLYPPEEWRV